jgi:CheY-like chemotaxis protein
MTNVDDRRLTRSQATGDGGKQMSLRDIQAVLLIEDNMGDVRLLREMFDGQASHEIDLTHVDCMRAAEAHLAKGAFDIILLDPGLPDAQGVSAIRRTHAAAPRVPLVVLTGLDDDSLAGQALARRRTRLSDQRPNRERAGFCERCAMPPSASAWNG